MRTKTFKKSIACTLAAFLAAVSIPVCTASATTNTISMSVGTVEGEVGDTVRVPISISGSNYGISGLSFNISLNDNLEYIGAYFDQPSSVSYDDGSDTLGVAWASPNALNCDCVLGYIDLLITDDANVNDVYDISLSNITVNGGTSSETTVDASNISNSSVSVCEYTLYAPSMNYYFSDDELTWQGCTVTKTFNSYTTDVTNQVTFSADSPADAWNSTTNDYSITASINGNPIDNPFNVKIGLRGDVTCDFLVKTNDASAVLKYISDTTMGAASTLTNFQLFLGDVDESSYDRETATASTVFKVRTNDSSYILSYVSAKSLGQNPTWDDIIG